MRPLGTTVERVDWLCMALALLLVFVYVYMKHADYPLSTPFLLR